MLKDTTLHVYIDKKSSHDYVHMYASLSKLVWVNPSDKYNSETPCKGKPANSINNLRDGSFMLSSQLGGGWDNTESECNDGFYALKSKLEITDSYGSEWLLKLYIKLTKRYADQAFPRNISNFTDYVLSIAEFLGVKTLTFTTGTNSASFYSDQRHEILPLSLAGSKLRELELSTIKEHKTKIGRA